MKLPITNPNEALRKLIKRQQTTTTSNNSDDSQKSSSSFLHLYEPPSNSTTTTTNSTTTTTTTTTSITPTPIFNNENHENNDSNNNSEINDDDSDSTINTTNTNTNTTNTTTIGSWTDTATVHHSPTPTPPTHTLTSSTSSLKSSSPIPFLDLLYKRRYTIHTSPNHINHNINNNSDANNSLNDDNNRTNSSAESVVEYHSELSPEPWWTINGLQPIMIRSLTSPTTPLSPSHHVSHHGNHQYYEKKLEKNDQEHENGENEQNLKEKNEKAMIAIYEDYFSHVKHDHDIENDEKHERKHEKHEKNDEKQFHLFRMLKNESLLHEIMNDSDAMCRVRRSRSKMSQLVRLVHSKPWIYSLSSNFEPKNENFGENNAKNRYQGVKKQEFTCVVWQSFSELYRLVDQLPPNCYQLFLKKKLKVHFHDDDNSGGGENGENHHSNVHGETQTVETGENRGSENVVNSKTEDDNENKENEGKNDRENIGNDTCTDNRTCHDGNDDDTTGENNVENRDEKACIVDDKMDDNNVQNVQNVQNAKSVENNVSSYSNSQNSSGNSTNGGGGGERRDGIEGIEENGETIFAHDSVNQILADVPRSKLGTGNIDEYESRMTESEMLIERTKLFNVLYSVCMFYPTIGYCQGMSYICTMLLRTMDHSEELTFFMMINLIENYEMRGLFVPSFPLLRKISFVFEQLMTKRHSKLWSHLNSVGISSELFIPKWLLPMFCLDFPQDFVLRVWDCFLLEGWKAIYQVLCAILVQNEAVLMRCTDPAVIIFRLQELPLSLTRVEQQCQLFESCSKMFSDRDYKKAVNEFEKLQQQEQQQRQQQVQRRSFSFRARSRSFFL